MAELFQEVLREITRKPVIFVVEIVQFAALLGILVFAVQRIVGNMLKERRERIITELREASQARKEYAVVKKEADSILARAKAEARDILKDAREKLTLERESATAQTEQEAKEIVLQAERTIEAEKNQVLNEAAEQLIGLVTVTTRRFIDEALTESERRALTQKIILTSLEEIDSISVP